MFTPLNMSQAQAVVKMVKYIQDTSLACSIGVICFFKAQVRAQTKMLDALQ